MERYTERTKYGHAVIHGDSVYSDWGVPEGFRGCAIDRLAAYEDTGLEPEQAKDAKRIAERIATADYPHNFQRERSDIVAYMRWITDVMRDAKTWWNGRIASLAETEATLEQEVESDA